MAKIIRKTAKIFGSTATSGQISEFGSLAAGTPVFSTDPAVIQSLSNWLQGWYSAIIANSNPTIQDMNAVQFVNSYQIAYGLQTGVAEWDSSTTYYIGSFVSDGTNKLYYSLQNNNTNHAVTDGAYWTIYGNTQNSVVSKTTTYTATTDDSLILCSGSSFTVTLPAASAGGGGKILRIQKTDASTSNIITIARAGSDTIQGLTSTTLNTQDEVVTLMSDGALTWYIQDRSYPMTWIPFTMVLTGANGTAPTNGTVATNAAFYRRNGGNMELKWEFHTTTAGNNNGATGQWLITLPFGTVDATIIPEYNTNAFGTANVGSMEVLMTNLYLGTLQMYDSNRIVASLTTGNSTFSDWSTSGNNWNTSPIRLSMNASVPITGWNT